VAIGWLLLVHADTDDREMYADYLQHEGYAVLQAASTDCALTMLAGIDAVITGLMVPGRVDAVEFIRRTRAEHATTPIVVVTACVFTDRMRDALLAGADVVLIKPCLPDTLLHQVQQAIADRKIRLTPPSARRSVTDRRLESRGGRRDSDGHVQDRNDADPVERRPA
jgi:DNA-binding response OmpR family regulator